MATHDGAEYLTLSEAAARYKVSQRTLRRRISTGDLPASTADDASSASLPPRSMHSSGPSPTQGPWRPRASSPERLRTVGSAARIGDSG